jgi:hypothetical protein
MRSSTKVTVGVLTVLVRLGVPGTTDESIMEWPVDKYHTPLQLAARLGHIDTMEALVDEGADLDGYGPSMTTALSYACMKNEADCAKFLINAGADPEKGIFKIGMTPLMLAAKHGVRPPLAAGLCKSADGGTVAPIRLPRKQVSFIRGSPRHLVPSDSPMYCVLS